jgi:hypothetical protein
MNLNHDFKEFVGSFIATGRLQDLADVEALKSR